MAIAVLMDKIKQRPEAVGFKEVVEVIASHYDYTPTRFVNGVEGDQVVNEAGVNEGSCKIFAFALLNGLDREETLNCFGDYYREDVLGNPDGSDHGNIRCFIRHGWSGIRFDQPPLVLRAGVVQ